MTRLELPAQAADLLRAVEDEQACNSTIIESLKVLLLPTASTIQKDPTARNRAHPKGKKIAATQSRAATARGKKQPPVAVYEGGEAESQKCLKPQERLVVATEVVNITLKVLTTSIKKSRTPHTPQTKSRVLARSTSSVSKSSSGTPSKRQTLLQTISVNRVLQSPAKSNDLRCGSPGSFKDLNGVRAQAECSRIALACLRSLQATEALRARFAPLQLENGMSALISKLSALGFDDLAINELRILRRRIGVLASDQHGAPAKASCDSKENFAKDDQNRQKDTLPDLLIYSTGKISGSLLGLVITSQIQVLKILALKGHGPSIEAALKHLQTDVEYAPSRLIERQINPMDPNTKVNAIHQLESLAQAVMRLYPNTSRVGVESSKSRSYPSAQVVLELQSLALRIRIRWWSFSDHQPNIKREVLDPFARYLDAFERRCTIESSHKYCFAKNAFTSISEALEPWTTSRLTSLLSFKVLANLAYVAGRNDDAIEWIETGLKNVDDVEISHLQRSLILCRLATYYLCKRGKLLDDREMLAALRNAIISLEGDLSGDSSDLDELLLALADLRKNTFSLVQENAKMFNPSQILHERSILGQSVQFILLSIRFLSRYVGREPAPDAAGPKLLRYKQRKKMAEQRLPSMIATVIAVSRLSVKSDKDVWRKFDVVFQESLELTTVLGTESRSFQESRCGAENVSSPHLSISLIYWLRYLALKNISAEAKVLLGCVQKSVDILESRPNDEKAQGCFLLKVEKYASLCETLQDYSTSAKYYQKAIEFIIDTGGIKIFAEAMTLTAWPSAVARGCEFEQIGRVISAFPKVSSKLHSQTLRSRIFYDAGLIPKSQRVLILEIQLTSLISILLDQRASHIKPEDLHLLLEIIFCLYDDKEKHAAQRLHVCVQLLHLSAVRPGMLDNSSLSKILEKAEERLKYLVVVCDGSPRLYVPHLASRRDLYHKLSEGSDPANLETIIFDWWSLAQQYPDRQELEKHVYDIPGWLQQLDVVSEYLHTSGNECLRTVILDLLVVIYEGASSMQTLELISSLTNLGIHYARLGYSGLGGATLQRAQHFLDVLDVSHKVVLHWCVANAEFNLLCGNFEKCDTFIKQGKEAFATFRQSSAYSSNDRTNIAQSGADLLYLQSRLASEQGHREEASFFARASVQVHQRSWASLDRRMGASGSKSSVAGADETITTDASELSIAGNKASSDTSSKYAALRILKSWYLSRRLFTSILHLSRCFAHTGILLEAQYYLEQCQKIADAVQSPLMNRTCLTIRGEYAICCGEIEQGLEMLRKVENMPSGFSSDYNDVTLNATMALCYMKAGQIKAGTAICDDAIRRIRSLTFKSGPNRLPHKPTGMENLDLQMAGLIIGISKEALPKKTRVARNKTTKSSCAQPRMKACPDNEELPSTDIIPIQVLKGELLQHSAFAKLSQGSLDAAMTLLDETSVLSQRQPDMIMRELLRSQVYLGQTLQRLVVDPVFSVLPESTICCPAVITPSELVMPLKSPSKRCKTKKIAEGKISNKKIVQGEYPAFQDCLDYLPLAQKCLTQAFSMAKATSSTSTIHTITETLGKILAMLSVSPGQDFSSSQFLAYTLELGRMVAMERESSSIRVECLLSGNRDLGILPEIKKNGENTQQQHRIPDFSTFQEDYSDIIPESWTVLSVTVGKSNEEMWVSRMRAGQSPFILRLPFNRENAAEHDDEGLTFSEGRVEMLEIIRLANVSAHSAGDLSQKGAKKEWWDTRATLDTRLKDLLTNIEKIWLGGFRSIFSSKLPEPSLLARFQKSLQNILDKHLPSRRTSAKTKQSNPIRFDPRILELFVGLGAPTDENDVDEQLMDLLYFIVDILQFHKERNAYDEIDFDAIVVETADALRQYHQAAAAIETGPDKPHTILILDRNLHCFPWESLPCMAGQSVSRLPSLNCMRRRLLQMREEQKVKQTLKLLEGICVDPGRGSYILNPGGDLVNTQATFEEPLQRLSGWVSFVEREPNEAEMRSCLQDNKLFLYFGHGSGGQYIRSRTIKRLDQCAVALLMGCSSGALTQSGEYEAYGTPISYMHGGSPALLATLWDVTDKDIDRFSDRVLRTWGLFKEKASATTSSSVKKSAKSKGKMKAKLEDVEAEGTSTPVSLDEAVAKSRDSCILKYLNGAAPVVYGIPVYLG